MGNDRRLPLRPRAGPRLGLIPFCRRPRRPFRPRDWSGNWSRQAAHQASWRHVRATCGAAAAAPAPRRDLPHLPGVPGEHLPFTHGRGRPDVGAGRRRPRRTASGWTAPEPATGTSGTRWTLTPAAELCRRGYDGSAHRARQVRPSWLADRDLILAMDRHNLADLRRHGRPGRGRAVTGSGCSVRLAVSRPGRGRGPGRRRGDGLDIPDPYGGDASDFGAVLDLIEEAARHIAVRLTGLLAGRAPA